MFSVNFKSGFLRSALNILGSAFSALPLLRVLFVARCALASVLLFVSLFPSSALASDVGALGQGRAGGLVGMLPFVVVVGLFYVLMIRPQQKKQKEVRDMLDALSVGDTVVTSGGIIGKVLSLDKDADTVTIMVDDKVSLLVYRKFIIESLDKNGSSDGASASQKPSNDAPGTTPHILHRSVKGKAVVDKGSDGHKK